MPRKPTGQIVERESARGTTYALRFRAYGERRFVTLGSGADGWTRHRAEVELENVLADVRRGIWRPPVAEPVEAPTEEATFWEFAQQWYERKAPEIGEVTREDYLWALNKHLVWFGRHRLSEITKQEVDRYKTLKVSERREIEEAHARGERLNERGLSANTVNKTLTRLAQILDDAVDYGLIPANPAIGRKRRLKGTKPSRPWVEPEQLPTFLGAADGFTDASRPLLAGRGRPLLATLAGAGLRIGEALALERGNVNLAKGTLTVTQSKTDAGVRVVELTPTLREELALWLDRSPFKEPGDLVFPTLKGKRDNRHNVVQRLFVPAIKRANARLAKLGIDPIGDVRPHGLRRTYASLRAVVGDDPVYIAKQIGHEDVAFTLKVYAQAVKRRERLQGAELEQFECALEWAQWAQMGTNGTEQLSEHVQVAAPGETEAPR